MKRLVVIVVTLLLGSTSPSYAGDGHDHSSKKHCEKKVNGKTVHLEKVENRKQCKQEGGRWVKHKKKSDHDHGSHGNQGSHDHEH